MRWSWLAAALIPAASAAHAKLEIRDVQAAHGPLGPERRGLDFYPADEALFRYTVAGAQVDGDRKAVGETTTTLTGPDGTVLVHRMSPTESWLPLSDSLPTQAQVTFPPDAPPGPYTLSLSYRDKRSGEEASFRRVLNIKRTEFAAVNIRFSYDADGKVPAPVGGVVGQVLYYRFKAVGFDRAAGRIDVGMDLQILDAGGRPALPRPIHLAVASRDADLVRQATDATLRGSLTLNRAGDFTLRLTLTDRVSKKTAEFEAPLHVKDP